MSCLLRQGGIVVRLCRTNVAAAIMIPDRNFWYSSKQGLDRDWMSWMQQPIDLSLSSIQRWAKRKQFEQIVDDHKFVQERLDRLGPDLCVAHFVVARDGAIKFENIDRWIFKNKDGNYSLPTTNLGHLKVEAVDMSQTNMMYNSFDNFENLESLRYLNISRCKHIDDWCLDKLSQLRDTLIVLDISGCTQVTERGVATLHRLRKLKRVIMNEMDNVRHFELTKLMLEQAVPDCVVEGHCHHSQIQSCEPADTVPAFVKQYELAACQKDINRQMSDPRNTERNISVEQVLQSLSERETQK